MAKKVRFDPNKPPYAVPTMGEIEAIPWCGLTAVSTFSGAGGTCLGLRMAGFRVAWASEFHDLSAESYEANFPDCVVDRRDIREVEASEILESVGLGKGEIDLFDGSPPCDSFSTAGKRQKYWGMEKNYSGGRKQRTDDLFFEYVRLLEGLMPRTFIAENVSGLVKGVAKGYFLEILAAMKAAGYRVRAKVLDAQWLGVPQQRRRVIFIGVRENLGLHPAHPAPLRFRYSVADALPWLVGTQSKSHGPNSWNNELGVDKVVVRKGRGFGEDSWERAGDVPADTVGTSPASGNNEGNRAHSVGVRVIHDEGGARSTGDVTDKAAPTVRSGCRGMLKVEADPEADMAPYAVGDEWGNLREGEKSNKYLNLIRSDSAAPSPTVTQAGGNASTASVTHPVECRKFYISELKRICAFPDDFILVGSYGNQWRCCGMAVPPVMAWHVARSVRDEILFKADGREPWGHDPECLLDMLGYVPGA
jgi:DNA (cytosine-5)-methyltransferase 1